MYNYLEKYIKYKSKYIELKNLVESKKVFNELTTGQYYLPSEFLESKKLAISNYNDLAPIVRKISEKTIIPIERKTTKIHNNNQIRGKSDSFIQDHGIILKHRKSNISLIIDPDKIADKHSGQNYGGNFISDPEHRFIFCIKGASKKLLLELERLTGQEIIEIDYPLLFNNERHIDEIMCFMPYPERSITIRQGWGRNAIESTIIMKPYKIWFMNYTFDFNSFLRKLNENITRRGSVDKKIYENIVNSKNQYEFTKTQNLIGSQQEKIFKEITNKIYKNNNNKLIEDLFVKFNFDINFDFSIQENKIFSYPPIVNRTLINFKSELYSFFPESAKTPKEIKDKITEEFTKMKLIEKQSDDNIKEIKIENPVFINTSNFHYFNNSVGGNLHCLIKNFY